MKTIISILCSTFVLLVSCNDIDGRHPYPPTGPVMLDLLFVDEAGNYLVKNLSLHNIPGLQLPSPGYFHVDPASYSLSVTVNGEKLEEEDYPCEASRESGRFNLIMRANMVKWINQDKDNPDLIYVYKVTFSCPGIYGDQSEHVFTLERKRRNDGLTNNAERLFYDGTLIVEGAEGAAPPGPDEPIVIVVARK